MAQKIIIDTDPGADDTAAILLALASPELSVDALTVCFGNGEVGPCTRNALNLLEIAGRTDIPVYAGANRPLLRDPRYSYHVHGSNAFGGAEFDPPRLEKQATHAALALVERVMANPGEMTLVALAPLTNVALALSLEPKMAQALKELVIMGGAVLTYGNASEVASANLYNDPEAAAIVYRSGAPLVQVGLDVCRKVIFSYDEFEHIRAAKIPTTEMLVKVSPALAAHYRRQADFPEDGYIEYNDVPAVAYCIDPGLFTMRQGFVRISTHDDLTRGETVADLVNRTNNPPNTKIMLDVNAPALKAMFIDRLASYLK